MPNPHSYPLWLLSRPPEAWQNVHSPIQATKFFCASVRVHRQQDQVEQGLRVRGYPRLLKNGENPWKSWFVWVCLVCVGIFMTTPHENDSGLLWWGKVASTRRGPAFCSSIPSILWVWVNTKNDIPSVHSPWLPVQPPLLLLTSPVLLVNPLSLLVNLSCVLANPHCCWLKTTFCVA